MLNRAFPGRGSLRGVLHVPYAISAVAASYVFTIPYVMTGGGPAGASEIWITPIFRIAFGRIRFGIASACSVILSVVMMALGYFHVGALTANDSRTRA